MRVHIDVSGSGAIATGTTLDLAATMKANGWRWSRNLDAWYLARTLRHETVDHKVATTTAALDGLGWSTEVTGADQRDGDDDRAARRLERDQELAELHAARARRADAKADGAHQRAHAIADAIPTGQPILTGHHSERRHRRDIGRMRSAMATSVTEARQAETERHKAASATERVRRATEPRPTVDPDTIHVGDLVRYRGRSWHEVRRVNAKTVTVPSIVGGSWTDRLALDQLTDVRHTGRHPNCVQ